MAITLQQTRGENINKFIDLLETNNVEERTVRYYAIAEVIINGLLKVYKKEENTARLNLINNKIVDGIGELTIIDRSLFASILNKIFQYHYNLGLPVELGKNIMSYNSILDVLGVSQYFSADDMFLLNKHFGCYRDAMVVTLKARDELFAQLHITDEQVVE